MSQAVLLMAEVGMFGMVGVGEVLPLVGLEDCELVGHVWVQAEKGGKVDVRDGRSLSFSMEFGVLTTQFD